jgi:hypothetical protein
VVATAAGGLALFTLGGAQFDLGGVGINVAPPAAGNLHAAGDIQAASVGGITPGTGTFTDTELTSLGVGIAADGVAGHAYIDNSLGVGTGPNGIAGDILANNDIIASGRLGVGTIPSGGTGSINAAGVIQTSGGADIVGGTQTDTLTVGGTARLNGTITYVDGVQTAGSLGVTTVVQVNAATNASGFLTLGYTPTTGNIFRVTFYCTQSNAQWDLTYHNSLGTAVILSGQGLDNYGASLLSYASVTFYNQTGNPISGHLGQSGPPIVSSDSFITIEILG